VSNAATVILRLAPSAFRGLAAPCVVADYDGSHARPRREYPFIDGFGHDYSGRNSYELGRQQFHFNNTIAPHDWYPTRWNAFREALEHPDPGDFDHPDLGTIRVVVTHWKVAIGAANLGGIVVDVDFEEHVDNLDERVVYLGPDASPGAIAAAADAAMEALDIDYPTGEGDGATSFSDAIAQIEGFVFSTKMTVNGYINRVMGTVQQVIDLTNEIDDHARWVLYGHLTALWDALKRMAKENALTERATATHITAGPTTLDALGRELGNTVAELIGLNLPLINRPDVPKSSRVTYYTGGLSIRSPLRPPGP
jgi:prophage DNA circulation protein